jgi:uncharacterized cysteine cluster protein YcgN (CxxCxxCC family)
MHSISSWSKFKICFSSVLSTSKSSFFGQKLDVRGSSEEMLYQHHPHRIYVHLFSFPDGPPCMGHIKHIHHRMTPLHHIQSRYHFFFKSWFQDPRTGRALTKNYALPWWEKQTKNSSFSVRKACIHARSNFQNVRGHISFGSEQHSTWNMAKSPEIRDFCEIVGDCCHENKIKNSSLPKVTRCDYFQFFSSHHGTLHRLNLFFR